MSAVAVSAEYEFIPLDNSHLPIIERWLQQPHVARWYDSPAKALESIRHHIDEVGIDCYLVRIDGRPRGYLQVYDPHAFPNHPYRDQPAGSRGIDQFIGEPEFIGRGHGPNFIRKFVLGLFEHAVPRVLTDPSPANTSAIRAYMKAGFSTLEPRDTEWGPVLLMVSDPNNR